MSNLKKLQKLVAGVEGEALTNLTKDELQAALSEVIDFLVQVNDKNRQEFSTVSSSLGENYQQMRQQMIDEVMSHKGELSKSQQEAIDALDNRMREIETTVQNRLAELRDGESPAVETIVEAMKPYIPAPLMGSPDSAEDVRNKLELLSGDDRLTIKAIAGLDDLEDIRKFTKDGAWGGGGVGAVKGITAGTNITVDNTILGYPVINATGGAPEGTAVLSTGEAGGTKFLREDGDGTCSWQTIAGGGDALVANPLSQFAATTSAQLAGVISNETGSGALVFANTPTLVTPEIGTATGTGLTLSGLTASEIVITNGTKGLASAPVATYPSLTELTYVKGVTSAIQTQLNAKGVGDALTSGTLGQFAATTSAQLAGVISDEQGSGALVFATSPTLTTPTIGVATATSINKVALTAPATSATITATDGTTTTLSGGTHSGTNTGDNPGLENLVEDTTPQLGGNLLSNGNSITMADGDSIELGTGGDGTLQHSGTTMTISNSLGDITYDNTDVDNGHIMRLGTDTSATFFKVQNNSTADLFTVGGGGVVTTSGNIELGHASDTTLARASAGVASIEGANIMTVASADTVTGTKTLGTTADIKLGSAVTDKCGIQLNNSALNDETWSGTIIAATAGATLAVGDVCYLASSGKWVLNDGILDGTDTGFSKKLGICVLASTDTNPTEILLDGLIASAAFPTFTVGSPVYLDDTAGDMVVAQPSTTNFAIRVIGDAVSATVLHFSPSRDYIVKV